MIHRYFVWLHRWTGLVMALFLILVGLTGTILAFKAKLERLLVPELFVQPRPGQQPLDLASLAEHAEAAVPGARVGFFSVGPDRAGFSLVPRKNPTTGEPYVLRADHLILNPYTGEILTCCEGRRAPWRARVIPFVYDLHTSILLGENGKWFLGIIALIWTLDCFVGFYLTLPRGAGGFWRRWQYAWTVKWRANAFRINFDLHRSGGLWFWAVLFVFAWSSVMLTLQPVYDRVTKTFFEYTSDMDTMSRVLRQVPLDNPKLDWRAAQAIGERLMAEQAAKHHFTIKRPFGMAYIPQFGVYTYAVLSSVDIRGQSWDTSIWIDGNTGELKDVSLPTVQPTGNKIGAWLWAIHFADIHDFLPFRILVSFLGLLITLLSVTGVYIWWKKRKGRILAASRQRQAGRTGSADEPLVLRPEL